MSVQVQYTCFLLTRPLSSSFPCFFFPICSPYLDRNLILCKLIYALGKIYIHMWESNNNIWLKPNGTIVWASGDIQVLLVAFKFWCWYYHLSLPSFTVVIHGAHRRLFVLCVTAQWLLVRSAMINSAGPRGRTARPGYSARDLVSSCDKASQALPELRLEPATFGLLFQK